MSWNGETPAAESSESNGEPLSHQANIISNALKEADKAMEASFGGGNYRGQAAASVSLAADTLDSNYRGQAAATVSLAADTMDNCDEAEASVSLAADTLESGLFTNAHTIATLNLKENDAQFLVIAEIIVAKYDHFLRNGARSFSVSIADKEQMDRMVNRDSFVAAVNFRLQSCPELSDNPMHVLARKCRALGLNRAGDQNPLYARPGTIIEIEVRTLSFKRCDRNAAKNLTLLLDHRSDLRMTMRMTTNFSMPIEVVLR
jgi:hypothetical protein